MSRKENKALHDLNPHQSDEYSSRNAKPSGEKQHHYYKRTREGRMNSEPSGEKQQRYYKRSHEGRMNSDPYGEKQQSYYQRSHEGRMDAEPSGQHSYKRRHEGSKSIPDAGADAFALKRLRRPHHVYEDYDHDHSKCLIAQQNRLEEPIDFTKYLFPSEERSLPLPPTSNKMKLNIVIKNTLQSLMKTGLKNQ